MVSRDIGDISTDPGGKSGEDWTSGARDSVLGLWDLNLGVLQSVSGTNSLTASASVSDGLTALADGMKALLVADNTNTGAVTLNVEGLGAKSLLGLDGNALSAGDLVTGNCYLIVFLSAFDQWRVVSGAGTTNVTLEGGLLLKRSAPSRLVALAGPTTALTALVNTDFSLTQDSSRVVVEGNVGRIISAGSDDDDGLTISLYVDGTEEDSFTDYVTTGQVNTSVYFSYSPGDTDSHNYEIRAQCTRSASYPQSSVWMTCSEIAPNS